MPIISSRFVSCAQKGGWRTLVHLHGIIEEMNDSKQAGLRLLYAFSYISCSDCFGQKYQVGKSTCFFLHAYSHVGSTYHVTIVCLIV